MSADSYLTFKMKMPLKSDEDNSETAVFTLSAWDERRDAAWR